MNEAIDALLMAAAKLSDLLPDMDESEYKEDNDERKAM